jgi:ribonuclease VapC
MVIDSSAVIAILSNEPEAESLAEAIANDPIRLMPAASLLETAIVIEARYGEPGGNELGQLLQKAQIKIEPVTVEQAEVARRAYQKLW